MKRRLAYGLLGLCVYAGFLVLQCPAAALVTLSARHWPAVTVEQVHGLARQGSVLGLRWRDLHLETAAWELRWPSLLRGRVELEFALSDPTLRVTGAVAPGWDGSWHFRRLRGQLPLADLMGWLGRPAPVAGRLEMNDLAVQVDAAGFARRIQGVLRLAETRLNLARGLDLGDFAATFSTTAATISGRVQDQGGPLQVAGVLTLDPKGRYRFTGRVSLRGDNPTLQQTLNWLGQPDANGVWAIDVSGTLHV
jgi:general secretion pathway protein N